MKTASQNIEKYQDQINDLAQYAKRIGFDPINGSIEELMKDRLNTGIKFCVAVDENKNQAVSIVKRYIK
jgi:hypothetical protein